MEPIHQWGLELIRTVQQVQSPTLNVLFRTITTLGSEEFYFLLLPLILWCIDLPTGIRVAAVFLLSAYVNLGLKSLFALPRPFELDPTVKLYDAAGYGLPSGHAQLSVSVWSTIAHALRRAWLWTIASLLAFLIGFSRIYLGVHFPTDVLMGWAIGALLLVGYMALGPPLERWLQKQRFGTQVAGTILLTLTLLLLHTTEDTASLTGVLMGAGVGAALLSRGSGYNAGGPLGQRAARFLLGIAVVLALRFGLKAISPMQPESLHIAVRYLRYVILGLWIAAGAPWLFKALHLSPEDGEAALSHRPSP